MMAFSQEYSFEGFGQVALPKDPMSLAVTGTRAAITVASYAVPSGGAGVIGIPTGGGSIIGLSSTVLGIAGLALTAIVTIYSYINGQRQREKMEHQLANQYIQESIQMGKQVLISYGYNPELVNQLPIAGLYAIPNLYNDKQALLNELSIYGIDASRFIYEAPVLKPEFTGNIERDLRVRELLIYTGYNAEQVNKTDWRVNINTFDSLNKLSTASTKDEVNTQIERTKGLLSMEGLDPTKFVQTVLPSITVPAPTAVATDTALLQAPEVGVQKVGFSLSPLLIMVGVGILILFKMK